MELIVKTVILPYLITGASDRSVSEALYLNDPNGNGVELYWNKPKEIGPKNEAGSLEMYNHGLDLDNLLSELDNES